MNSDNPTYSKTVIMIADYMFANCDKKMTEILSHFVAVCHKDKRTVQRYVRKAKKYNEKRQNLQEKAKSEVLVKSAKETAIEAENRRKANIKILEEIRDGKFKIEDNNKKIVVPTINDIMNAIREINRIDGNYAPVLTAQTASGGNDIIDTVNINIRKL